MILRICTTCNGILNSHFEETAKCHVRAALDGLEKLNAEATVAFARWMIKTMLLARHPETEYTAFAARKGDAKNRCNPWKSFPATALTALLGGEILDDLSLWVTVVDAKASLVQVPTFDRIFLNTTFRADSAGGTGNAALQGFNLDGGRMAVFQLVFHPLQDFEHPFEAAHLVTRLWPKPPTKLDLSAHTLWRGVPAWSFEPVRVAPPYGPVPGAVMPSGAHDPALILPSTGLVCGIPSTWQRPTARRPGGKPSTQPAADDVAKLLPPGRREVSPRGGRRDAAPSGHSDGDLPARRGRSSSVVAGAVGRNEITKAL